ncbi:MAG: septum formation initiator family protein [Parcubacteria group bacterium]|jgi:cell division protein FtsB
MKSFFLIIVSVALLGVLAFFSIPTFKEMKRSKNIESEISALQSESEELNAQNNFLKEKIGYLQSDHYKESVAKDRLSLRNVGEKVVVVQPNSKVLGASANDSLEENNNEIDKMKYQENLPNYKKWWEVVKGGI